MEIIPFHDPMENRIPWNILLGRDYFGGKAFSPLTTIPTKELILMSWCSDSDSSGGDNGGSYGGDDDNDDSGNDDNNTKYTRIPIGIILFVRWTRTRGAR